jgi:hypothetical protein
MSVLSVISMQNTFAQDTITIKNNFSIVSDTIYKSENSKTIKLGNSEKNKITDIGTNKQVIRKIYLFKWTPHN